MRIAPRTLAFLAVVAPLVACGALIGTKDIYLDADATTGSDGGNPLEGGDTDSQAGGDSGQVGDAKGDGGTCNADLQADPKNCGACAHDCLGGACTAGKCQPKALATGQGFPIAIVASATDVYWTDLDGNALMKADKTTGAGGVVQANGILQKPYRMAIDTAYVYWVQDEYQGPILRCPLAGCGSGPTILAMAGFTTTDIAVSNKETYWYDVDDEQILRAIPDGGPGAVVASGTGTNNFNRYVNRLIANGGTLFWSEASNGEIWTASAPTAADAGAKSIATGLTDVGALATDGTSLYYAIFEQGGSIGKMGVGGNPQQVLTASQVYPISIAVDGAYLYWLNEGNSLADGGSANDGKLMRCPVSGCGTAPEVLVSNLHDPRSLTLDTAALYFVTAADGTVWKLAK